MCHPSLGQCGELGITRLWSQFVPSWVLCLSFPTMSPLFAVLLRGARCFAPLTPTSPPRGHRASFPGGWCHSVLPVGAAAVQG